MNTDPLSIPGYDPATAPVVDFDQRAKEYHAATKLSDARNCYKATCPDRFTRFNPEHPNLKRNPTQIKRVLEWHPKHREKGMLLMGETGLGKTHTVWEMIRRLSEQAILVRAYHSQQFFSDLAGEVKFGRDDASAWIDRKAAHPIVFIDDWGQEANLRNREEWAQSWFFRFIDLRLERGLPLIITTNLTAEEIGGGQAQIRSDPLLRRLLEICEVVKFV